ncbi:MAG: N-methyl-L-tryptophan oxidase, partial [Chloroflexota bacterium]
ADTIIIGLGGMGSAVAYQLARRKQRVVGLEKFGPAHNRGSSHGGSRIIRQAYYEHPAYVPLLLRAYELWRDIDQLSGQSLLSITGGLMIGSSDEGVFQGSLQSAEDHQLPHEVLNAAQLQARFPAFRPQADTVALLEKAAGFLHPERSIQAFLDQATRFGADLHFFEPALQWQVLPDGSGVQVITQQATYEAERLIISPGAWASELLADIGIPFQVERIAQFWMAPTNGFTNFQSARFPIFLWEIEDNIKLYGFPAMDDGTRGVKVAIYPTEQWCTPETINRTVSPEEIAGMRQILQTYIPELNSDCLKTITCMHTFSPDDHFIVAHHPQHKNVIVAAGFSAHGFKFASVIGEILADLAITGQTNHPIDLFASTRFAAET